ncbi:TPA: tyrosine-type recombinase/integrase [Clostridium perfringens]|nr:tyrosine-type recombinase/integrase [Clostridium perfringens]MBI6111772.1 tyrosine-type recombinase/integrase [Clostridium perfringens]MBI6114834.1 tyrosine-type recombinase/integrase [Clostridium perfringens]UBK56972.1 tyrosine-type recombinase/integrase [Clostridium perfringens]HBI7100210.1 tyrosine-type recombinase/integrase [Clostridium perfringens]
MIIMGRKIPEVLTIEEQKQLLNIFNIRYFNSRRNKVMIELFLCTGLRLSEMLDLKWKDINLMSGQLKVVQGKGKKDRILWVNEDMLNILRNWKIEQSNKYGVVDLVFCSRTKSRLDDKGIRKMIETYSIKAGINKHVTPHTLRHTYATDLLRETKNIRLVQKALGHADLSTTMIYTHIVDDEYEDALKNFRR